MTMIETSLDRNDVAALKLAMEMAMIDPGRKEQLEYKLKDESWHKVAEFAAYSCQMQSLKLKPWEDPPCWADEDEDYYIEDASKCRDAQRLLRRMLKAGVSRYHPDPMAALAVKQKSRRA